MLVLSVPSPPGLTRSNPNPFSHSTRVTIRNSHVPVGELPVKLSASANNQSHSPAAQVLRQLSVSSVFLLGLGLSSLWAFSPPAIALTPSASPSPVAQQQETRYTEDAWDLEDLENNGDEELKAAIASFKSKTYSLTVPLRFVALGGSVPTVWIKEFLQSQGKRARLWPEFRRTLLDIFLEVSGPFKKGKSIAKSAATADLVTLGDSWLNFAIAQGLVEPLKGADAEDWFRDLGDKWKVYLRRSTDGNLNSKGEIWAAPYRWGSMVIAYKTKEFRKHKLAPIEDWSDLWRPELTGKISMIDSPREIVGTVLKHMGASYNSTSIDSQVVGGKNAVLKQLDLLVRQVRLFDSQYYLKAFTAGDVWVAVGWSSDILPAAKTMSNVSVIVPKSGASLWADLWAVPNASRLGTDKIGGRIRGPSPLVHQFIEFCLQPERALPFKEDIIPGASPMSLDAPIEEPRRCGKGRPKLNTNLIGNVPPAEIMSRCEFLEPLSEDALSDYQWLLSRVQKPNGNILQRVRQLVSSVVSTLSSKLDARVA